MPLTALEIKRSQPKEKDYWLNDERGLRLLVKPNGSKYWRLKYRFANKQKTLALGIYPDVSLKKARLQREQAKLQISQGVDPSKERQIQKRRALFENGTQFSVLALEWWEYQKGTWTEDHAQRLWKRIKDNAFKEMDLQPMEKIEPRDILAIIRKVESRDALDVASRVLQDIRRVFRYGVQNGKIDHNPVGELTGILKPRIQRHRASLPVEELGQFLVDLKGYETKGRLLTQLALEMLIFTFVRPGEVRGAQWSEFDLENQIWRIPAHRMKMQSEHLVPLSSQVIRILDEIKSITWQYELLFPSERNRNECISDNTMRRAMIRMGYDGKTEGKSHATPHGFRANASSVLNEKGFNPDAIERQLSHSERNGVRAAYIHHAHYLEERKEMMQWGADYLVEKAGVQDYQYHCST
ncbi:MAG: tyrosine-type recombinase/integrase [Gammaproteobacteria bacterium]|nr:tyrosine-type recombinase/integrase [Gammaproteobacteria bacterium]